MKRRIRIYCITLFFLSIISLHADELNTEISYCFRFFENNPAYYYYDESREDFYFDQFVQLGLNWQSKDSDTISGYADIDFSKNQYSLTQFGLQLLIDNFRITYGNFFYSSEVNDILTRPGFNYDFALELQALLFDNQDMSLAASLYDSDSDGIYDSNDLMRTPFIFKYKASFFNTEILYYFNHYFYPYRENYYSDTVFNERFKNILSLKMDFSDFEFYTKSVLTNGADRLYIDENLAENLHNDQFYFRNLTGGRLYLVPPGLNIGLSLLYKQDGYSPAELEYYYACYKQMLDFDRENRTICDETVMMKYYILGNLNFWFFNKWQIQLFTWYSFEEKLLYLDVSCLYFLADFYLILKLLKYIEFDTNMITTADLFPKTDIDFSLFFSYNDFSLQLSISYWLDSFLEAGTILQNSHQFLTLTLSKKF